MIRCPRCRDGWWRLGHRPSGQLCILCHEFRTVPKAMAIEHALLGLNITSDVADYSDLRDRHGLPSTKEPNPRVG